MKKSFLFLSAFTCVSTIIFVSCKKETACEECINGSKPPIAIAGPDQGITLPTDSISLDGSASNDPDGTISEWLWKKISGPASFNIRASSMSKTNVSNLVAGIYQFELKVTDAGGLFSKDTVKVNVNVPPPPNDSCPPTNRPVINAQLISIGNLSVGRTNMATVSAGNKIFFAGGTVGAGTLSSRVDIYDITSQTWSTAQLSIARHLLSAVASGNMVFFAGGFSTGATSRVDIYNLTTQTWSVAELSQARAYIETASVGNKVFFCWR